MRNPNNEQSKFTCSEDAEALCRQLEDTDRYSDIVPALLNSADIHDYIETTGMVFPYDPSLMKSSSYEARIGEYAFFWDEEGKKREIRPDKSSRVELKPNSLVFFETKEEFRLPPYMALRFNLRIKNVYRGLLLGTGPLVDPGFEGKLLVPIHNLTNNTYSFQRDETFIWIEFTKISPNKNWQRSPRQQAFSRHGVYEPFPLGKKYPKPPAYFEKANRGNSINNATPKALFETSKIAECALESANDAKKAVNFMTFGGVIAVLVLAAAFLPLIYSSVSLSKDVSRTVSEFRKEYQDHIAKGEYSQYKIEALDGQITDLKAGFQVHDEVSRQQSQLDALGPSGFMAISPAMSSAS